MRNSKETASDVNQEVGMRGRTTRVTRQSAKQVAAARHPSPPDSDDDELSDQLQEVEHKSPRADKKQTARRENDPAPARGKTSKGKSLPEKLPAQTTSSPTINILPVVMLIAIFGLYFYMNYNKEKSPTASRKLNHESTRRLNEMKTNRKNLKEMLEKIFPADHQIVAKSIVAEVLERNLRQVQSTGPKKALVLHFAGNADEYDKMQELVVEYVLGHPPSGLLQLGRNLSDWDEVRETVFEHLRRHPRSVIILQEADKAPFEKIYNLEDAFENADFEFGGERADCTRAIFIIRTEFVKNIKEEVCSEQECKLENRIAMVRHVKMASQNFWTRPAFVARIRDLVPFV
mmetsp:Transcript_34239/g.77100  ORF Transcript_34239/g.77100 Transcript_34239/m.77100 type:complete len:346 (-) Transcript_34239:108-1145(-)|eukprot:746654-Hanusia_phi.AAC.2